MLTYKYYSQLKSSAQWDTAAGFCVTIQRVFPEYTRHCGDSYRQWERNKITANHRQDVSWYSKADWAHTRQLVLTGHTQLCYKGERGRYEPIPSGNVAENEEGRKKHNQGRKNKSVMPCFLRQRCCCCCCESWLFVAVVVCMRFL